VTPFRSDHKVLIVAPDALLAALIGVLVEASRLQAAFPETDESIDDALGRVRPLAAVLVDAVAAEAGSDVFLARARRAGVPVLLFGPLDAIENLRVWAAARDVSSFVLPRDTHVLTGTLERLAQARQPRGAERRTPTPAPGTPPTPSVRRNGNGELILDDGSGGRWTVFDRRAGDRRAPAIEREFVSELGEVRRCTLTAREAEYTDAAALSRQLADALTA
jgi:hypothetical protein